MKRRFSLLTLSAMTGMLVCVVPILLVVPANAAITCLKSREIAGTSVIDPKNVDFQTIDGSVYRSGIRKSCPGLKFSGFVYRSHNGEVCEFQSVRVLNSGELCFLGTFRKVSPSETAGK